MSDIYDLIIIGGGPAGLTAGIYASRRKLNNLIITKDIGGQASSASQVENFPGYEKISGFELMQKFQKQAASFGAQFNYEEVKQVKKDKNGFTVETVTGKNFQALSLILTFGKTPANLNVPGEKEFFGKGVAYCTTCDGPLFKNKTVAIIGGGNSALESVEYMAQMCPKVYLVHRRDQFRAEEMVIDRIKALKNVEIFLNSTISEIKGDKFVKAMVLEEVNTKAKRELAVEGIFIDIGYVVNAAAIKNLVALNENNEIKINSDCQTSVPGIFAAGDVTDLKFKQIVISAGEGAKAALSAYNYISELKGAKSPKVDWGRK